MKSKWGYKSKRLVGETIQLMIVLGNLIIDELICLSYSIVSSSWIRIIPCSYTGLLYIIGNFVKKRMDLL